MEVGFRLFNSSWFSRHSIKELLQINLEYQAFPQITIATEDRTTVKMFVTAIITNFTIAKIKGLAIVDLNFINFRSATFVKQM